MDKSSTHLGARSILVRFSHLFSAQVVEGVASAGFFLYLAWLDSTLYGEIMYALAAGSLVGKMVQYGLYYPTVSDLSRAEGEDSTAILNRVNIIKLIMLGASMAVIGVLAYTKGFDTRISWILVFICLGIALEAIAETLFAHLRVKGFQHKEARIRMAGVLACYGFGFAWAASGLDPVGLGLHRFVQAAVMIGLGVQGRFREFVLELFRNVDWSSVWAIFRAATPFAMIIVLGLIFNRSNVFFLEYVMGVKDVAYYSAAYNLVDPICVLASQQFLGFVIFPMLAGLWTEDRPKVEAIVRGNALWLAVVAFPIMFVMQVGSDIIVGILYPGEYNCAAQVMRSLSWTVLISFESNLFWYVMMVSGAVNVLVAFAVITTALNLIFNVLLVPSFGLAGSAWVLVLSKLLMAVMTISYCQWRFRFFRAQDSFFPLGLACLSLVVFLVLQPLITKFPAAILALGIYVGFLWRFGMTFLGDVRVRQGNTSYGAPGTSKD